MYHLTFKLSVYYVPANLDENVWLGLSVYFKHLISSFSVLIEVFKVSNTTEGGGNLPSYFLLSISLSSFSFFFLASFGFSLSLHLIPPSYRNFLLIYNVVIYCMSFPGFWPREIHGLYSPWGPRVGHDCDFHFHFTFSHKWLSYILHVFNSSILGSLYHTRQSCSFYFSSVICSH